MSTVEKIIKEKKGTIVDVRSRGEFDGGHGEGRAGRRPAGAALRLRHERHALAGQLIAVGPGWLALRRRRQHQHLHDHESRETR